MTVPISAYAEKAQSSTTTVPATFFPSSIGSWWKYSVKQGRGGPVGELTKTVRVVSAADGQFVCEVSMPGTPTTLFKYTKDKDWISLQQQGEVIFRPAKPIMRLTPRSTDEWTWTGETVQSAPSSKGKKLRVVTPPKSQENYTARLTDSVGVLPVRPGSTTERFLVVKSAGATFTYRRGVGLETCSSSYNDGRSTAPFSLGSWGWDSETLTSFEIKK